MSYLDLFHAAKNAPMPGWELNGVLLALLARGIDREALYDEHFSPFMLSFRDLEDESHWDLVCDAADGLVGFCIGAWTLPGGQTDDATLVRRALEYPRAQYLHPARRIGLKAQLRGAMRALLFVGIGPGSVVATLDRVARELDGEEQSEDAAAVRRIAREIVSGRLVPIR